MLLKNQTINVLFYGILVVYLQYSMIFLSEFLDVCAETPSYCSVYALNVLYYSLLMFVPTGLILSIIAYLPLLKIEVRDFKFAAVYFVFTYLIWSIVSYFVTFHIFAIVITGHSWIPYLPGAYNLVPYMIWSIIGWATWIKLIKAV